MSDHRIRSFRITKTTMGVKQIEPVPGSESRSIHTLNPREKDMKRFWNVLALGVALSGCATNRGTVRAYLSPDLNSARVTTVAILPLRNAFTAVSAMNTGEMLEINSMFQTEFTARNPGTRLINSASAIELLNQRNLVDAYSSFLTVYHQTGIPNTETLVRMGEQLSVDAVIQGFVMEASQQDGVYTGFSGRKARTTVTVKYVMFSTRSGTVWWEATLTGLSEPKTALAATPPLSDAIVLIREKLRSSLPVLSTR